MKTYEFELQFYLADTLEVETVWNEIKDLLHNFSEERDREGFGVFSTGISADGTVSFGFQILSESLESAIRLAFAEDYLKFPFRKNVENSARAVVWIAELPE